MERTVRSDHDFFCGFDVHDDRVTFVRNEAHCEQCVTLTHCRTLNGAVDCGLSHVFVFHDSRSSDWN